MSTAADSAPVELQCTPFHKAHTFEKRKEEADRLLKKHAGRLVPVIVYRDENDQSVPELQKHKYLVPDITAGQFMYTIRQHIVLRAEQAMFFFVNKQLVSPQKTMWQLYREQVSPDGFMYMIYRGESTFG